MNNYISVKNMSFAYRDGDSLFENFNLDIKEGEYVAIIGHNGCGKSTLAKILCGILLPNSGIVTVNGIDTADDENFFEIRKSCGMIFQNPDNQLVATVVEEDVAFAPENLGVEPSEIRKIVDEALKTVGMEAYAKRSTSQLSGGQKQRVAIAGILAMRPRCIIFDEATSMLDPEGRKDIIAAMKKLNKENGITVITITHYMSEAVEADRIIVLNKSKIIGDGTPKDIFSDVKMLNSVSLASPQITQLSEMLIDDGFPFPKGILHTMEAADVIESYLQNK
ncbi:MAG: energy-coupling factor transporter ATPase [Ruminococcaceae bacterium]|nr:energy-coupling factor transporter ATPase [Oscillospiraceae bacterium]